MEILINWVIDFYYSFYDVLLYPGKYINLYVGHILVGIVFVCFVIVALTLSKIILHNIYIHLVYNTVYAVGMVYYQLRIPSVEVIHAKYRTRYPHTWILRFWFSLLKTTRSIEWYFDRHTAEATNIDLKISFDTLLWPKFIEGPRLKAFKANGWKPVDEEPKDETVD